MRLALNLGDFARAEKLALQLVAMQDGVDAAGAAAVPRLGPVLSSRAAEDAALFSVAPLRRWLWLFIAQANLGRWQDAHDTAARTAAEGATLWALLQSACALLPGSCRMLGRHVAMTSIARFASCRCPWLPEVLERGCC